jgi:hypothetical protein
MKLAYSVCTTSYLWQAEALTQSFLKYNPDYKFIVCVVDRPLETVKQYQFSFELVWIEDLQIPELPLLIEYYNVFSLLMAAKGIVADILLSRYQPEHLIYLDTDILVFHSFDWLAAQFEQYDIFITPHCHIPPPYQTPLTEVKTSLLPQNPYEDRVFLLTGLYNAGFVAIKNTEQGRGFAAWWSKNLKNQCFPSHYIGLFFDQIWLNLVPIYFDKTCIVRNLGYNMGCWSLHERKITIKNGQYYVNDTLPLVFFHYTGYRHQEPNQIAEWISLTLDDMPALKPIFEPYQRLAETQLYKDLHKIPCAFAAEHQAIQQSKKVVVKEALSFRILRKLLSFLPNTLRQQLKKALG